MIIQYIYIFENILYYKLENLTLKDFMKKYHLKTDTISESQVQRVYSYPIYPGDSKIYSDKRFVNIDNGSMGGSHWVCFIVKDNKSYCFDSFGGQPDKYLLNQLAKRVIYHNYKIQ